MSGIRRARVHTPRRRFKTAVVLLVTVVAALWIVGDAFADAGNPVLGTIVPTVTDNGNGTVTISVKGQWNWVSHKGDCNLDRAGTGVAIMWSDPSEDAWPIGTVGGQTISVGIKAKHTVGTGAGWPSALASLDLNPNIDRAIHPADRGDIPKGLAGPAGQSYVDPPLNPSTGLFASPSSWRAGCGRSPMTKAGSGVAVTSASKSGNIVTLNFSAAAPLVGATVGDNTLQVASMFNTGFNTSTADPDVAGTILSEIGNAAGATQVTFNQGTATGSGLSCSTAATCKGKANLEPLGSWGYDSSASGPLPFSFKHIYVKKMANGQSGLPNRVCVNFYDQHGGPAGASASTSSLQVDSNNDNSVDTNDFDVTQGENCINVFPPTVTTGNVTNPDTNGHEEVIVGNPIHDDAKITGVDPSIDTTANPGTGGTVEFDAFSTSDCSGTPAFTTTVAATGSGGTLTAGPVTFTNPAVGTYKWTATYTPPANGATLSGSSDCPTTATDPETDLVSKAPTDMTTDARVGGNSTVLLSSVSSGISDTASLTGGFNPTGTITFTLYRGTDCSGSALATRTVNVNGTGSYSSGDTTIGGSPVSISLQGFYHWQATYSGDGSNIGKTLACGGGNEDLKIINPSILVTKTPHTQRIPVGGTANWTITITNNVDGFKSDGVTKVNPGATLADQRGGLSNADLTLTNVNTNDPAADASCSKTAAQIATLRGNPPGSTFAPGDTFAYSCSRVITAAEFTGNPPTFANVVTACGTALTANDTCDNNPNDTDHRTGTVTPEDLISDQNVIPNDNGQLTGAVNPNGTMHFSLYRGSCTAGNLILGPFDVAVDANGKASTSNTTDLIAALKAAFGALNYTSSDGTYNWRVTYTGDTNGNGDITPGTCGSEHFTIDNDGHFSN